MEYSEGSGIEPLFQLNTRWHYNNFNKSLMSNF
jgi:hypothetical protein